MSVSVPIALLILSACGGDSAKSSADTNRATSAPTATHTAGSGLGVASGSAATPANGAATPSGPVSALTIVATDNIYTPAEFQVRAGEEFSVTLENHGQAIHDWRVRGVTNAEGKDAGTALLQAGQSQTITLAIEQPGDYAYYCEVHPVEMRGRLVVK